MSKAEEIAREIAQEIWGGKLIGEAEAMIAAALRAYADEKLEEAAMHIEAESDRQDTNYLDHEEMCRHIRALKSSPPKLEDKP